MIKKINVDNPVFVMGTGRCGLSPLMRLLAYHPDFAWPSQLNNRFPKRYFVSFLSRSVDLPLIRSTRLKYKKFPHHEEAFSFYNDQYFGFAEPYRDLTAEDVSPYVKSKFRDAIFNIMKYQNKTRFIAEYSGWSRMGFLKAIFPEAKFIHIVRDGRAVANSLTNVHWWDGWGGVHNWRWGIPDDKLMDLLMKYDHSFIALAAIHWKILIDNILEQSLSLPGQDVLVLRYEDMVKNPSNEASTCIEFCDLDQDNERFKKHISTVKIVNANKTKYRIPAWRENLTEKQIEMLDDILEEELVHFNYLTPRYSSDGIKDKIGLIEKVGMF